MSHGKAYPRPNCRDPQADWVRVDDPKCVLMKQMRLRYAGACRLCGASLPAGTEAIYVSATKNVRCLECATEATETMSPGLKAPFDDSLSAEPGVAGASARREYERRKAKDEEKLREKWGRFGGLAVVLSDERPHNKS